MAKSKLEYIWLDGNLPTQSLRGKTKVLADFSGILEDCPMWSFDGSSTQQAETSGSDCVLKPVAIFPDPGRLNAFLVMTEVLNADGTAHESNGRATIEDDDNDFWFGFEQEYFLWDPDTDLPLGFPAGGFPGPQGPYYCSVGAANSFGREIVEEHLDLCLGAGLNIEGINGASPEVIMAHIDVYGASNHLRLTGLHETQAIDKFSYAISDRGASIRIPIGTINNGWKGYLEDRRPASDADPYKVAAAIIRTVKSTALPATQEAAAG
jgi:glutamine synthetase